MTEIKTYKCDICNSIFAGDQEHDLLHSGWTEWKIARHGYDQLIEKPLPSRHTCSRCTEQITGMCLIANGVR